jgi:hypothetical protein
VRLYQPATLNAAEWRVLSALAKEKKVFLMEGQSCQRAWKAAPADP